MKRFLYLIVVMFVVSGCRTYVIDSNPQGLQVTIDNNYVGLTPFVCRDNCMITDEFEIKVEPPTAEQIRSHENERGRAVEDWTTDRQVKKIDPTVDTSGTIMFNFIKGEEYVADRREELPLHYYNTYWDDFSGALEADRIYKYVTSGVNKKLRFTALQKTGENEYLFYRFSWLDYQDDELQDLCETVYFWIISDFEYTTDAPLRAGRYLCLGTHTYETKSNGERTVYVLKELNAH